MRESPSPEGKYPCRSILIIYIMQTGLKPIKDIIYPVVACSLLSACADKLPEATPANKEALGKTIFFDESLSHPAGQSCATCHTLSTGYADKYSRAISEGAVAGLFGNRNAMTISYAAYVPRLHYDPVEGTYLGGLFWDGRVPDLQAQAGEPFLNPLEMGNPDRETVVEKAKKAAWFPELQRLYGDCSQTDSLYRYMTDAIAAFESSAEINPFSSRFDAYLAGEEQFTDEEKLGMEIFREKGMCAECHIMEPDPRAGKILFTDHTYDNLGIPRKQDHPYYRMDECYNPMGTQYVDPGLGAIVNDPAENGKFRVPTLRNIALTAPYGHNGYFATLEEIVHFYNARDVAGEFPPAEYPGTVNRDELGDLKLSPGEEAALIAFMLTLTDRECLAGECK